VKEFTLTDGLSDMMASEVEPMSALYSGSTINIKLIDPKRAGESDDEIAV